MITEYRAPDTGHFGGLFEEQWLQAFKTIIFIFKPLKQLD